MTPLSAREIEVCRDVRQMCACNKLRRSARAMTQLYDAALAPSGLKITQLPILVGLRSRGDVPVTALAEALGLDRTTLTRNLRVLDERGLVTSVECDDDARVRLVSLTGEGREILAAALERWQALQDVVEERFGSRRLRALYGELEALSGVDGA